MNEENNVMNDQNKVDADTPEILSAPPTTTQTPRRFSTCTAFVAKHPKPFVICGILAALVVGFGCGRIGTTPNSSYDTLVSESQQQKYQYDQLQNEYDEYKTKMQPYESVQLTDAQNKAEKERQELEEKRAAEEQAQKEAEEKAAAERAAEAERKAAEEKAAAEAKAAEEAKGYETGITFDNLARTPDDYKGKKVKFEGKVIQVIEGDSETQIRLAINGDYDTVIFCRVPKEKTRSTRILEDDYIHIMGVSNGLISYQSTLGGTITIPDISVDEWGQS